MILGLPVFDASAPSLRVKGRKISNWWADVETLWSGIGDSLFGFRVYPMAQLERVMRRQLWMRRFDFDVEAAVRLCWRGVRPINIPAPVRYFRADEGGVSHFNYWRDNALLTWMHCRLFVGPDPFTAAFAPVARHWRRREPAYRRRTFAFVYKAAVGCRTVRHLYNDRKVVNAPRNLKSKHHPMSDKASLLQQPAPVADVALQRELAGLFVQALNLEVRACRTSIPTHPCMAKGWALTP